jgi:hypothetical protein
MRARLLLLFVFSPAMVFAETTEERALAPYQPPAEMDGREWTRERLLGWAKELADYVFQHHVVTEESRKTFGMTYEFVKDGKPMQDFGLDAMHDGAWLMSALVTMQRADPGGDWLARAQKYQAPFYINLLNHSDQLFPQQERTSEDAKAWPAPFKGWCPRGWDDGPGLDFKTEKPFGKEGWHTASNHLSQDLADTLLNYWLSTRDPGAAEALKNLRAYKRAAYGGKIEPVEIGAAVANEEAHPWAKTGAPSLSLQSLRHYSALLERKASELPSYNDGLAWQYRETSALAVEKEAKAYPFLALAARAYAEGAAMESFFDDGPYEPWAWSFDLQRAPQMKDGKWSAYHSEAKGLIGPRGVQVAWVGAATLPALNTRDRFVRNRAGFEWDAALQVLTPHDARTVWDRVTGHEVTGYWPVVNIRAASPKLDGERDEGYGHPVSEDGASIFVWCDPKHVHLFIESSRPTVLLRIGQRPAKSGFPAAGAEMRIEGGEVKSMVTWKGDQKTDERMLFAEKHVAGATWKTEIRIPQSHVPGQKSWINVVDFGIYDVETTGKSSFVAGRSGADVAHRLEQVALGNLEFWHRVWKENGVLPSGWHHETQKAGKWTMSDAGSYAHLLHLIAFWRIYQDGKAEWELIRANFPKKAGKGVTLPEGVLRAQGLGK